MKFDFGTYIGKASCDLATQAGQVLELGPACSRADFQTIGYIATALVILLALAIYGRGRENRRRNRYLL